VQLNIIFNHTQYYYYTKFILEYKKSKLQY